MMRIIALNEDSRENSSDENEPKVTKEAQETIAISEYMRALKLKNDGRIEDALFLFSELLETSVLIDVTSDQKDNKLFSVKYNCFRNVGLIYEKKNELKEALKNFYLAMQLDDTDVFTMHKLGKLALKEKNIDLAKIAFEKCLVRNPNHWPSVDGMLQVLCLSENLLQAYGWALHWYKKDKSYERAYDVLSEINEKLPSSSKFFESIYDDTFEAIDSKEELRKSKKSNFPEYYLPVYEDGFEPLKLNFEDYNLDVLDWKTMGDWIYRLYKHLEENNNNMCTVFTFDDFITKNKTKNIRDENEENIDKDDIQNTADPISNEHIPIIDRRESVEGSKKDDITSGEISENDFVSPTADNIVSNMQDGGSATEGETNKLDDIVPDPKPRARRRGSELSILEQWGWHKNRRYRKKSTASEQVDSVDTSINGFIKKVFAPYFNENLDSNRLPFLDDNEVNEIYEENNKIVDITPISLEEFQENTKDDFELFINKLKDKPFDLYIPICMWLDKIACHWNSSVPIVLREIYLKLYGIYLNYMDAQQWSLYEIDEFQSSFRSLLFYLELEFQRMSSNFIKEIPQEYEKLLNQLLAYSGHNHSSTDEEFYNTVTRLVWLQYCIAIFNNDLNKAIACILKNEDYINQYGKDFEIKFYNQKYHNFFDLKFLKHLKIILQRKFSLNNIRGLYKQKQFNEIVKILQDCLKHITEFKLNDELPLKAQEQIEVLLESLWYLDKPEECLDWCERCIKYSIDNFLCAPSDTPRQKDWADSVDYILNYIEGLLNEETNQLFKSLNEKQLSRLIQSLTKLITNQLDSPLDKNNPQSHPINLNKPWIILHQILLRDEDKYFGRKQSSSPVENLNITECIEENIPNSIIILFTAHDYLGRKGWCSRNSGKFLLYILEVVVPLLRSTILEPVRELVMEYIEQITYCLYGYPAKKARSKHIEEHDSIQIDLTWDRALQLFDIYRPDNLPEFNSYKLESISAEMEQLLNKIIALIPREYDHSSYAEEIKNFISGTRSNLPDDVHIIPYKISCIYYLLGDYYFKSRDFLKTIKFYILDLTLNNSRFDSWAGIALSKATKMETKLNSCQPINENEIFTQFDETSRCFEQCLKLNKKQTLLWIEYGTFSYSIHAFCSRNLKQCSDTLSMEKFVFVEEKKEECINIAFRCFDTVNRELIHNDMVVDETDEDPHNERWLYQYMLGKIAEKKKEQPTVFLSYYLQSAKFLYENNATYPFKINHSNPQNLSIEALEMFYRISASIIKYIEQHRVVQRSIGKFFNRILKELSTSPFALNQAKIDDSSINALKRKLNQTVEEGSEIKIIKVDNQTAMVENVKVETKPVTKEKSSENVKNENIPKTKESDDCVVEMKESSPNRRGSQESNATTSSNSTTGNSSSSTSSSSSDSSGSDSSSSDSESDSSSDGESKNNLSDDTPFTDSELENIYKICIKNFEECVTRFPEHYKSIYRLVNFYMNAPTKLRDFEKAKQLLLGTYTTSLGNSIQGLFFERKSSNFFNGIWRIPSSEIDRAGSFSSHLSKCVVILMEVLKTSYDYNTLLDLAFQLQRTPEPDKRYLKDSERKELFQQAISFCVQTFRSLLKKYSDGKNNTKMLDLMIDIFKSHRKCFKSMQQKDVVFSSLLVDAYKAYIKDKVVLPENANLLDLAGKLCQYEITARKNQEKQGGVVTSTSHLTSLEITTMGQFQSKVKSTTSTSSTVTSVSSTPTITMTAQNLTSTTSALNLQSDRVSSPANSSNTNPPQQRNRGKNISSNPPPQTPSSSSMNVGIPFSDTTLMATMLAMYNNTNLVSSKSQITEANLISSLMADYYTKLGLPKGVGNSQASAQLLSGMLVNAAASAQNIQQMSSISKNSSTSSSTVKTSRSSINVGSDISITTASSLSIQKEQSNTKQMNQKHTQSKDRSNIGSSSSLPSVLKKDLPSFTSKILQDLAGAASASQPHQFTHQGQNISLIPEASKLSSNTNNPTTVTFSDKIEMGKKLSQIASGMSGDKQRDSQRMVDKVKMDRKNDLRQSSVPYNRSSLPTKDPGLLTMNMNSQYPHFQEYNRQLSILQQQYVDALKYNAAISPSSAHQQQRKPNPKIQQQSQQNKSIHPMPRVSSIPPSHTALNKPSPSNTFMRNNSPNLLHSPNKSPVIGTNFPRNSMTPPIITQQQTKTLQQKLAEQKQKANASMINQRQNEASTSGTRKDAGKKKLQGISSEVIILE